MDVKNSIAVSKKNCRVHYGSHYENAFWDGKVITFGDGHNRFYPFVTLDIMGHELGTDSLNNILDSSTSDSQVKTG